MLTILREITVTCFLASYLIVLVLELLRLCGRIPGRGLAVIVMMVIGLFTHVCYLLLQATAAGGTDAGMLATWSDWSLLLSLATAICFFVFYLRRPDTIVSFFFLPVVMGLIALALAVRHLPPFTRTEAVEVWRNVHAASMATGSAAVLVGFLAGVMYLVQSWRLKRHRAGSSLRLPTLESLGRLNRRCLIISTVAVALGLLSGVVMNLNRWGYVSWTDRGVLLSLLLLIWLVGATLMEFFYAPASRGRKAVYLTLASLGFLILAMVGILTTPHGQTKPDDAAAEVESAADLTSTNSPLPDQSGDSTPIQNTPSLAGETAP
ncbi:Cytochrome C assembly protein [Rubripirellula lacrimiformis]|uniref:Cytochrome C assembly protein n=1 Tax=Rubripirellula lacrimiformis TaxID=1930273 RepID=A0A517NLQ5_9BACT|nr:cytochrome c biogenesis protein CcsA [Rubripirellula lacrimiformis]QDT08067.1 Cytochrome C assembly protein [Rubripirellula lacrimiformis]